jgi:hypothetical protein
VYLKLQEILHAATPSNTQRMRLPTSNAGAVDIHETPCMHHVYPRILSIIALCCSMIGASAALAQTLRPACRPTAV